MNPHPLDLNADLGEGYPFDEALMEVVSSANICSGAYIENEASVEEAIQLATQADLRIGIHVGYPDVEGFGRRTAYQNPRDFESALHRQVDQFLEYTLAASASVHYLKPHGALYHDLIPESDLWEILFKVCETHRWPILHLAHSDLLTVAATVSGAFNEAFVDRRYKTAYQLVDRQTEGAVLTDIEEVLAQAVNLATGKIILSDGTEHQLSAESLCLHGDTVGALTLGKQVRHGLEEIDVEIRAFV